MMTDPFNSLAIVMDKPNPNGVDIVGHETGMTVHRQTACNRDA